MGGPNTLIKSIENNYKIDIDNYVMVNFESFAAIVDAMGGITVDVQEYEANHSNSLLGGDMPYGEDVTLNGTQALYFCRIRNCDEDGDVSRTRRQRQVIDAIIDKVKNASIKDLNKYIDILLPYVDTGYSKTQILSLGIKALTGKWYSYERNQLQMPDEECRTSGSANAWIWVVDYQLAAHKLQNALYGMTNIKIEEGRTSLIDVYRGANYTGSYSNSIVSPTENDVTTLPQTTEGTTAAVTEPSTVPDTTEEFSEIETTVEDIPLDTEPVDTTFEEIPDTSAEPEPTEVTEAPETQEPATEPPVTEVQ
jgi:LCP family protein required for cell wall assembly